MSHNAWKDMFDCADEAADPGASGTIRADRSPHVVPLVSTAAQTRTLARPTRVGALCFLYMRTDGGDITLTITGGFNEAGTTTFVFANAGEFIFLVSAYDGTNYYWRQLANSAIAASGTPTQGAALTAQLTTITPADAEGTPDYAIAGLINTNAYGFVDAQEGITVLYVIKNLQVRLAEVEARLEAAGIVAAN